MEDRITEQDSAYDDLQRMSVHDILTGINREDARVHEAVRRTIPVMELLVERIVERMQRGGRMFYIGAGTSGRLGVTDASELPPTYGVPFDRVIGLIAGGDGALRRAVEHAEDDTEGAWRDMAPYHPTAGDVLIGIAASGTTPYVIGGLRAARRHGLLTGSITCNPASPVAAEAEYALEAVVGPEFVTGSTRMKAGTAQKLMLNMLSTAVMIRLGRVEGNRMVNMQLTNDKLVARGTRMVAEASGLDETEALGFGEAGTGGDRKIDKTNTHFDVQIAFDRRHCRLRSHLQAWPRPGLPPEGRRRMLPAVETIKHMTA